MSNDLRQNDVLKDDNLSHHEIEQTKRTNKEQTGEDILKSYAVKHGAKNINAYIAKLKETGSAAKIICEYKKAKKVTQNALMRIQETQNTIKLYQSFKQDAVKPETSTAWQELGKLLGYQKKLQKQEG